MRKNLSLSLAILALAALPVPALAATMDPGMWSLEMTLDVAGRKQSLPAVRECISPQDIADPTKTLPRPDGKCTLSNVQRTPERATYDIACMNGGMTTMGRADIGFGDGRYSGTVAMSISDKGGPSQALTMTIMARRVGDCTK